MNASGFLYDEAGAVATLTLNRPDTLNSLTFEVYRELTETFKELATRDAVRAVVITGAGRAFCAGGDVKEIIGELLHYDQAQLLAFTRLTCDLVRAMRALPKPVVAALNGTVAGAGAAIAVASDLRIAADTARIAFTEELRANPVDDQLLLFRALALAYLGRKEEAVAVGQPVVSRSDLSEPSYDQHQLARIYLLVGEPEKALDLIEQLLAKPYLLSPGWLRIDPNFASLKGNPRFDRLAAGK